MTHTVRCPAHKLQTKTRPHESSGSQAREPWPHMPRSARSARRARPCLDTRRPCPHTAQARPQRIPGPSAPGRVRKGRAALALGLPPCAAQAGSYARRRLAHAHALGSARANVARLGPVGPRATVGRALRPVTRCRVAQGLSSLATGRTPPRSNRKKKQRKYGGWRLVWRKKKRVKWSEGKLGFPPYL